MNRHVHAGFTLIELMTALTVLGVLLALATPSFREFTRSNRVTAAQNDLVTAFALARSEALKQGTAVAICASTDGASCSGDTNWGSGWIVFRDGTGTAGELDAGDKIIQNWPASANGLNVAASDAFVQYTPTGVLNPMAAITFDVYATGCSGDKLRRVAVSPIGLLTATLNACP